MERLSALYRRFSLPLSVLLCVLAASAFSFFTGRTGEERIAEQERALNTALERCITTCYALEGSFPPDLEYMEARYGLDYSEDLFFVDYQPAGANIRPFYYVIRK